MKLPINTQHMDNTKKNHKVINGMFGITMDKYSGLVLYGNTALYKTF